MIVPNNVILLSCLDFFFLIWKKKQGTLLHLLGIGTENEWCTLGPRTTLLLGHQKCSVMQKSTIQGYCYVVIVLYKKISAMQGQYYIVRVLKTSAMQVKIEYVLK